MNDQTTTTAAYSATYSPEDNKLRLYSLSRLPADVYARVKAAGFAWAPKQELFVAPMWTPGREDLLIELCGEIGDEDTSLVDRAAERADRFEDYSEKRAADAARAREAVAAIADNIPLGQPILIGHHSERHARKDAERIENGMRKAVRMWETSNYWTQRAAGALRNAKYKERPDVRARRIKGIEADQRKRQRQRDEAAQALKLWSNPDLTHEQALLIAGRTRFADFHMPRKEGDRPDFNQHASAYTALQNDYPNLYAPRTLAEVVARALSVYPARLDYCARWISHYENRLAYERAMLADSGYTPPPKAATKAVLPLLNYRGSILCRNRYTARENITYTTVDMTSAEYAAIHTDYKGTAIAADGSHRIRLAVVGNYTARGLSAVFLTDKKAHPKPGAVAPEGETKEQQEVAARIEKARETVERTNARRKAVKDANAEVLAAHQTPRFTFADETGRAEMEAMRQTLKAGVQVVSAPQLFPTPRDLAARVVDLADIGPGHDVLEPSAGTGSLVGAMGGRMFARNPERGSVVAVEINATLAARLRAEFPLTRVHCADFLSLAPEALGTFDRVVMNPPFRNAEDVAHIQHARKFLRPGGRLVAICANGPRQAAALRDLAEESGGSYEELPEGSFAEQGTNVRTALVCICA